MSAAILTVVAIAALLLRLGPALATGGLRGRRNYDDGVHFAAAQELLAGNAPYVDFTFLHPPGVIVFGLPFAAAGQWWGDDVGLALARVAIAVVGAANAMMIANLLSDRGAAAALVGGGMYAVWPIPADTEDSFSLVPLLTAGLLLALTLLRNPTSRRRVFAAGVVLGLTCSFKLWPALLIAVVLLFLAVTARPRAPHFILGAALGAAVWALPVLLVGRGRAVEQILLTQASRPRSTPLVERLVSYGPPGIGRLVPDHLQAVLVASTIMALVVAGLVGGAALWAAIALVAVLEVVLLAPSFYDHYLAYTAPGICLLLGTALAPLFQRSHAVGAPIAVGCAALGLVFTLSTIRDGQVGGPLDVGALADEHSCIWSNDPALLITIDVRSEQVDRCPSLVDGFGTALLLGADEANRVALEHLRESDAALVLPDAISSFPTSPMLRGYLKRHFFRVSDVGPAQAWVRRGRGTVAER